MPFVNLLFGSFIVGFGFTSGVLAVTNILGANSLIAFNSNTTINPTPKAEEKEVKQS